MSPEAFYALHAQLQAVAPEMTGVAVIFTEGVTLYQEGEMVVDPGLIGVAGAAVMRLAEHIGSGLDECSAQEITFRCARHAALLLPVTAETLVMVVLPVDADTRKLGRDIRNCKESVHVELAVSPVNAGYLVRTVSLCYT
jgi:predicted regulator of Ras-like GTPase activity (Roadblock/LC7/MglB family)